MSESNDIKFTGARAKARVSIELHMAIRKAQALGNPTKEKPMAKARVLTEPMAPPTLPTTMTMMNRHMSRMIGMLNHGKKLTMIPHTIPRKKHISEMTVKKKKRPKMQ